MLRGYRSILDAFVGLALAGAQPPKEDGGQPTETPSSKIERSLEDIASSQRKAVESSDLEKPCKEGDDQRSSDLCAQWKAADAAKTASLAAWLGALIGAFTLAAAYSAAKWARKAAKASRKGNKIALDAQRAWVNLRLQPLNIESVNDGLHFKINVLVENVGGTVATHYSSRCDLFTLGREGGGMSMRDRLEEKVGAWKSSYTGYSWRVLPPHVIDIEPIWERIDPSELVWDNLIDNEQKTIPVVVAAVFYRTISEPDGIQLSWRAWMLGTILPDGHLQSFIRQFTSDLREKDIVAQPAVTGMNHTVYPAQKGTRVSPSYTEAKHNIYKIE